LHAPSRALVAQCFDQSLLVPDERDEAIRGLSRAREDAVRARLAARHQLKAMLLRHGHRYGTSSWTQAHERYLAKITFAHAAQDATFAEYRHTGQLAGARQLCQPHRITAVRLDPIARAAILEGAITSHAYPRDRSSRTKP
jgi:hypothetical protein